MFRGGFGDCNCVCLTVCAFFCKSGGPSKLSVSNWEDALNSLPNERARSLRYATVGEGRPAVLLRTPFTPSDHSLALSLLFNMDAWLKDVAPSDALRRWFGHDPAKWTEFRGAYFTELDAEPEDPIHNPSG